jgi:hypothetical protein
VVNLLEGSKVEVLHNAQLIKALLVINTQRLRSPSAAQVASFVAWTATDLRTARALGLWHSVVEIAVTKVLQCALPLMIASQTAAAAAPGQLQPPVGTCAGV